MILEIQKRGNIISDKLVFEKTGQCIQSWLSFAQQRFFKINSSEIFEFVVSIDGLKPLRQTN